MEPLLRQDAAAAYLQQSVRTLERWRVEGRGPEYIKVGRLCFYTEPILTEFIERQRRQSTSQKAPA